MGDRPATHIFVCDQINVCIRGLNPLEVYLTQCGNILIPVILSNLPTEIRLRIAREGCGK